MNSPESYKRRKTMPASTSAANNINDLSADLCCIIADFLPKTSRALLAVALTAPSASFRESEWKGQPNALSQAIISRTKGDMPVESTLLDELCEEARAEAEAKGKHRAEKLWTDPKEREQRFRQRLSDQMKEYYCKRHCSGYDWSVLDFVDLPISLAMRLSDDDVGAILVCIDAKNKLERLKLTHCTNVVGHGLEPLRSSTRLQYLDLGLVRQFEKPYLARAMASGTSFEFLFDNAKLTEDPVCGIIDSILRGEEYSLDRLQYPQKWNPESDALVNLNDENVFRSERMKQFVDEHSAIVNKFSCCVYFDEDNEGLCSFLQIEGSDLVDACNSCSGEIPFRACSECSDIVCCECCDTEECDVCMIVHCPRCKRDNNFDEVTWCEAAGYGADCPPTCSSCRLKSCRDGTNTCSECRSEVFGELLDECNTKQVQIDSQNDEMKRLRSIIEELTLHNK